jgi:hypothetical protein
MLAGETGASGVAERHVLFCAFSFGIVRGYTLGSFAWFGVRGACYHNRVFIACTP